MFSENEIFWLKDKVPASHSVAWRSTAADERREPKARETTPRGHRGGGEGPSGRFSERRFSIELEKKNRIDALFQLGRTTWPAQISCGTERNHASVGLTWDLSCFSSFYRNNTLFFPTYSSQNVDSLSSHVGEPFKKVQFTPKSLIFVVL